jgi:alpha-glucosidase
VRVIPTRDAATESPSDDPAAAPWWRTAVVYQLYPRSFADSDGDGVGDLPGITARLPHIAGLGVDAVWLSPFYVSPMADAGYDVADYRRIDPVFGDLDDADRLIAEAGRLGLRVLVDLVPNHTSDEHEWFRAALAAGPGSPERARYLFRDGRGESGELPPNGWRSVFGGSAWTRVEDGQWYLHLFDTKQPDLDWTHPEVREEFHDILRFWLDRGVAGFRVDVAHGLTKAEGLPEWEHEHKMIHTDGSRAPMWDQDGVHEIYRGWREVLDAYPGTTMIGEAWVHPPERLARYVRAEGMHQVFHFDLLRAPWRAGDIREAVASALEATAGVGASTTWVLSNHDVVRHTTRLTLPPGENNPEGIGPAAPQPDEELGLRRGRAATALMLALPGSAYLYQGEELGLPEHTTMPDDVRQDPSFHRRGGEIAGRDGCRVPLPWEADAPAYGFSPTGEAWLPQPESYARYAADRQRGVPGSTLELYRTVLRLRRELRLADGPLAWVDLGDDVVAFHTGPDPVLVVTNTGAAPVALPLGEVLLASGDLDGDRLPPDTTVWVRPSE